MNCSEKNLKILTFQVDEVLNNQLKHKAMLENTSVSNIIRTSVNEYINKDVNIQTNLFASCEAIRQKIKKTEDKLDLFTNLFIYWLEYYFAYTKSFGEMDDSEKQTMLESGRKRQEALITRFKKQMKDKKKLFETLICDYINQDGE